AMALAGDEHTDSKLMEQAGKEVIFARHIIAPDDPKAIWTLSLSEIFNNSQKLISGIALLTWIVGLGTLLAGIIGVSNIMLVLVKERTQEIGVRRAIGARPRAIITQILSESFVLTFIAGVLGLAAAVWVLSIADSIYYQNMVVAQDGPEVSWQISFGIGVLSLIILMLGSLIAGIIPASRALKIKAVDAIREE
ncbi:MAG: FtsX-like permease family protein, partial [Alistipes sp.]